MCVYTPLPLRILNFTILSIYICIPNKCWTPPKFTLSYICIGCTLGSKPEMLNKPKLPLFKFLTARKMICYMRINLLKT